MRSDTSGNVSTPDISLLVVYAVVDDENSLATKHAPTELSNRINDLRQYFSHRLVILFSVQRFKRALAHRHELDERIVLVCAQYVKRYSMYNISTYTHRKHNTTQPIRSIYKSGTRSPSPRAELIIKAIWFPTTRTTTTPTTRTMSQLRTDGLLLC